MTDIGVICNLTGIRRNILARRLRADTPLSTSQGSRVYGVALALDAILSLYQNDVVKSILWLNRQPGA
jgi:uncharacterized protein (DUF2384 family)